jgi:hypothetical protein
MKLTLVLPESGRTDLGHSIRKATPSISGYRRIEIAWQPSTSCNFRVGHLRPRVINVDGHPPYPSVNRGTEKSQRTQSLFAIADLPARSTL